VVVDGTARQAMSGHEDNTTSNRMEVLAAIKGLEAVPSGARVTVYSDSQYVVNTMTRNWRRQANLDLWAKLDQEVAKRQVSWEWVQGHAGHLGNEEANLLASKAAGTIPVEGGPNVALTHVDEKGQARMVDVGWKGDTEREAVARGFVSMKPETLKLITSGGVEKGDVLSAARIAGIMAAKRTPDLIPLCHPLPLTQVSVELVPDTQASGIHVSATVKTVSRTGVEMEALTAVAVAGLTIYDMCKAIDRGMRIENVRLAQKRGGKSGEIVLED
jgi:cyclic pyranopterin phosphate synthase